MLESFLNPATRLAILEDVLLELQRRERRGGGASLCFATGAVLENDTWGRTGLYSIWLNSDEMVLFPEIQAQRPPKNGTAWWFGTWDFASRIAIVENAIAELKQLVSTPPQN